MSEHLPIHSPQEPAKAGDDPAPPALVVRTSEHQQLTLTRGLVALGIAIAADLAFPLGEAVPVASDIVVAILLAVALRGRYWWALLPALLLEAIPGVGASPFWTVTILGILGFRAYSVRRKAPA